MNLKDFCFPVVEREVYFASDSKFFNWKTNGLVSRPAPRIAESYKAIVRSDTNRIISIVTQNYKLISNELLIDKLLEQLRRTDQKFEIEPHHSFVRDNRMRLHIKFPELFIKDDSDEGISLSLFIHNSYDMSEGIRMFFGGIRSICVNGIVFGNVLAKFYGKHTKGFNIKHLKRSLENTYNLIPDIQERINVLDSLKVDIDFEKNVKEDLGKTLYTNLLLENNQETFQALTQLQLFHLITNYISHRVKQEQQARYQIAASKLFKL